jgi:hypothetical protein
MTNQLLLIDSRPAWRLDRATRTQGLEGVANARAVLQAVDAKRAAEREADEAVATRSIDASETVTELAPTGQTSLPLADAA